MMPRKPAACGTDSGYYRHLRGTKTVPPTKACEACLAAHSAEVTRRTAEKRALGVVFALARGDQPRRTGAKGKIPCRDCGGPCSSGRCRSCAAKARSAKHRSPDVIHGWVRHGLIWRAVS